MDHLGLAGRGTTEALNDPMPGEQFQARLDTLIHTQFRRLQNQFRPWGRLVGVVDTRESLDLTGAGFLVLPLGVTLLTYFERGVHINLEKLEPGLLVELPIVVTIVDIRTDKSRYSDTPTLCKKLGHFTDPANVLGSILAGESQVLV